MDNKKVSTQSTSFTFSSSFSSSSNGNVTNTKMTRYSKSNINGNTKKEEFEAFDNDKHMLMKKENGKVISQKVTKRDDKLLN